jgi:tetratricopeptide (TPR) repeat protein
VVGYANLAKAYAGLNRVEEARATLNTALQHKASTSEFRISLARLDWAEGKDADMEKELQAASATPDGAIAVLSFRGDVASARGQLGKARDFSRQLEDALDRLHLEGRAMVESGLASNEALAGNSAEATHDADEAVRLSRNFNVLWNAGMAYSVLRQDQKATVLADEIQRTRPNDSIAVNVAVPMIRALAALRPANPAKADPAKATDFLNSASLYFHDNSSVLCARGLAAEQAGHYAEAQQDLQKVLEIKSHSGPDIIFAFTQLESGRVFQKQGETPKARIAYQNFLAAWKDADPEVPLLHEAKAEYAKLQ